MWPRRESLDSPRILAFFWSFVFVGCTPRIEAAVNLDDNPKVFGSWSPMPWQSA